MDERRSRVSKNHTARLPIRSKKRKVHCNAAHSRIPVGSREWAPARLTVSAIFSSEHFGWLNTQTTLVLHFVKTIDSKPCFMSWDTRTRKPFILTFQQLSSLPPELCHMARPLPMT